MGPQSDPSPLRPRYTVLVTEVGDEAWELVVRGRPDVWTVAFSVDELEERARQRIALDMGLDPGDFDVMIEPAGTLHLERRAHRRDA